MSDVRLRARSTTEIVDAAFTLYRQQPLTYMMAAAIGNVPYLVGAFIVQSGAESASLATSAVGGLMMFVSLVVYGLMSAVVMHIGSRAYLGEAGDLGTALQDVLPKAGSLIAAGIARNILLGFGLILFVVPFFWVFARYFAVVPAITLENLGQPGSFRRSVALSDGRKGHILATMALVWVIYFVVAAGLGGVIGVALGGSQVISTLVSTLITIAIYPVLALTEMVLYYDSRIRAEGFDLDHMTQALGRGGATLDPTRPA